MPFDALILVLLAGLAHAAWNIAAKKAGGDARFACFSGLTMVGLWSPLALTLAVRDMPGWGPEAWLCIATSGVLSLAYVLLLLRGYRVADLTVVYPLARGTGPLLTALVAVVFLGEPVTPGLLAGLAGVAVGVFLIAGGPGLLSRPAEPAARARVRRGVRYGLATGALIAGYSVVDGYAVKHLALAPVLVNFLNDCVRTSLLLPGLLRDRPAAAAAWRQQWRHALLVGALSPAAYVLVLTALQSAPLSHVAPAREISMLFAALLGGRLLGETDRASRLLGAACIAAGVMALAWG